MSGTEKPFACLFPGCNMSFTNEDHLVVHKKKHDMILNLGTSGKAGAFVADQTPTPTRFIRNCEEVGLFQDLQNVNPFEETFRRAVESGKLGLSETEIDLNDDTLHTPHVFLHIDQSNSKSPSVGDEKDIKLAASDTVKDTTARKWKKSSEIIVIQEADTSIVPSALPRTGPTSLSINGEEVQLLLKTQDGKMVQLSAIPICDSSSSITSLQTSQAKSQTIVIKTDVPIETTKSTKNSSDSSLAKMRLRKILTQNDSTLASGDSAKKNENSDSAKRTSVVLNEAEKSVHRDKAKILERNRASSMRSRAKRKEWIQRLQTSVGDANAANATLQAEIKVLRSEVARLKTLLLAHKDCSVTKAIEQGNNIAAEPDVVWLPPRVIGTTLPINKIVRQAVKKKITTDGPSLTTKKKLLAPKLKQQTLLPKIDEASGGISTKIIGNSCSTIKIIDLGPIFHQKEQTDKPISIIHDPTQNQIQVINSRQVVHVDQSLQLINVASKTTGT